MGVGSVRYKRADIYKRDGWICQICFEPVDPIIPWPESLSKSIDHVIPLILGGPDAPSNVQLAHLVCNFRKHTKIL